MVQHTVRAFDDELKELNDLVFRMGDAAARQLRGSNAVQKSGDAAVAQRVIESDRELDELQARIEERAISTIAKRQPVAVDLRLVIATLKIATDLERIGDLAKNNAKRVVAIAGQPQQSSIAANLEQLGRLVAEQIERVVEAFAKRDDGLVQEVWSRDGEVDTMQTALFRELLTYMMEDPRNIGSRTHLLFCARNLERIGDHATNIAEQVHYIVAGKPLPLERPKGENASDLPAR